MRCSLGGFGGPLAPIALQLANGVPFLKAAYVALGYTNYDVVCIGAAGGMGGGAQNLPHPAGVHLATLGGGGGGGGLHRKKGLLSSLPASCPVQVGAQGADGALSTFGSVSGLTSGAGGGRSSFNYPLCVATGGGGGSSAFGTATSLTTSTQAAGGVGGIGGIVGFNSGGGAAGGTSGNYNNGSPTPNGLGAAGSFDGVVGAGGGGGAGGVDLWNSGVYTGNGLLGSYGGKGSQSLLEPLWGSDRGQPGIVVPGFGGGAASTPLSHLLTIFGSRASGISNRIVQGAGATIIVLT